MDVVFQVSYKVGGSISDVVISTQRRRHLAQLMVTDGSLTSCPHSPSSTRGHQVYRRPLRRSRSLVEMVFHSETGDLEDLKLKNIRQTELLVDLRESILAVGRHFQACDARFSRISLMPDYSLESHAKDHEVFLQVSAGKRRRAKALLDFERHDDDELGFRKNDIITVVSMKDEHCWVGELNGLRGWFPAKFVEVLDERSKQYSSAGDDGVSPVIADLVRGNLCSALKAILEHGMKKPSVLGSPCHPWQFIEEVANYEVKRDFGSVYSRLVLCKTYRLDEDGKVLTPEELLYRCVVAVNRSHDVQHAQLDVKLRSLICMGLNEQVFHLWLEILASAPSIVAKWYNPWGYLASPGWVQVKCELRVLSQFPFSLKVDWELPPAKKPVQPMREGVRDMLVKHHLFSWDL
ncbi:unnamed protein product [Darwinula stevensoni]|uniref:Small G protein signaling modulator 3 n=1 Tax=Darwinula stevensoni TaxID=69355 RepID=A0A7R9FS09_9CRUS|nr:unnamed protein product [Darwinula stevensoni]CAG0902512.1 unnamed protein product [Darwinula stevensoni]